MFSMNCSKPQCWKCKERQNHVVFWDVDAPATLERVENDPDDPFRKLIPRYDFILTYGGGSIR